MVSDGGEASRIIKEIEKLKAEKSNIEDRISALQAQLAENVAKEESGSISSCSPLSINGLSFDHGLSPEMIYRYSRHLLLPSFGVQGWFLFLLVFCLSYLRYLFF